MTPRRRALLEALRDEDASVRASASEALDRLDVLEGLPELRGRLRQLGKLDWLRLLRSLVGVRDVECLKLALGSLAHREEDVRLAALDVAEAYSDWRASASVAGRLSDRSALVRARAVEVLGNLGDRRRAGEVAALLKDPDPAVVAAAAGALGLLAEASFEPALLPLLAHPVPAVRAAGAAALGRMGLSLQPEPGAPAPGRPDERAD
ncbi:MAG: HEAT repeat domain-containing protein [Deltaproteobacteria bacterium]|nr:HEAT repeat domain-containing protein [Deltaproteobacteria bacterium]